LLRSSDSLSQHTLQTSAGGSSSSAGWRFSLSASQDSLLTGASDNSKEMQQEDGRDERKHQMEENIEGDSLAQFEAFLSGGSSLSAEQDSLADERSTLPPEDACASEGSRVFTSKDSGNHPDPESLGKGPGDPSLAAPYEERLGRVRASVAEVQELITRLAAGTNTTEATLNAPEERAERG